MVPLTVCRQSKVDPSGGISCLLPADVQGQPTDGHSCTGFTATCTLDLLVLFLALLRGRMNQSPAPPGFPALGMVNTGPEGVGLRTETPAHDWVQTGLHRALSLSRKAYSSGPGCEAKLLLRNEKNIDRIVSTSNWVQRTSKFWYSDILHSFLFWGSTSCYLLLFVVFWKVGASGLLKKCPYVAK